MNPSKSILLFLLIYIVLSFSQETKAQSLAHWKITNEDGLPSMTVYSLLEAKNGYMWFGTANGLAKYDGSSFTSMVIPGSFNSDISYLNEDKYGRIWGKNFSGGLFYAQNDSMFLFNGPNNQGIGDYFLASDSIYFLSNKELFVTPLNNLDAKSNVVSELKFLKKNSRISGVSNNKVIVNDGRDRIIIDIKTRAFSTDKFTSLEGQLDASGNGFFWKMALSRNVVYCYDIEQIQKLHIAGINHPVVVTNIKEIGEFLYVTTKSGLYKAIIESDTIKVVNHFFKGQFLSNLIMDREQNLWVSTLRNGVLLVPDVNTEYWSEKSNLGFTRVTQIRAFDAKLFLGGNNGKLAEAKNSGRYFFHYKPLKSEDIRDIEYDSSSNKLYAIDNYLGLFNAGKADKKKYFSTYPFKDIAVNGDMLLAGTSINAFRIEKKYAWNSIDGNLSNKQIFRKRRVLHVASTGALDVIGYDDSLMVYKNGKAQGISYNGKSIIVRQMSQNPFSNKIAILSYNSGLFELDTNSLNISKITESIENFTAFEPFSEGYYLSSGKLLYRYNCQQKALKKMTFWGGLQCGEIYSLCLFADALWIGTSKGLYCRRAINKTGLNITKPLIHLKSASVNNRPVKLSQQQFDYQQNQWEFNVVGIAYKSKGTFRIKYRLVGLYDNWKLLEEKSQSIIFNSLPPGKYKLEVLSINESGVESEKAEIFSFSISSPFWTKWWFVTLVALVLIGITALIVSKYSSAKLKRREEQLKQSKTEELLRKSQLSAIKSQMNPHFIFNALNSIQDYILTNEKRLANNYLGKFADLMRMTLELSNLETVSLKNELELLKLYLELESLRFEGDFNYEIEVENSVMLDQTLISPLLLQPYVENAIKHGLFHQNGPKELKIKLGLNKNRLQIIIEDNGIGRSRSMEINASKKNKPKSFSTDANEQRMELINFGREHKIELQFEDLHLGDKGTKVIITIPS